MLSKNLFQNLVVIVLVGIGLGIGYNLVSPKQVPWVFVPKEMISLEDAAGQAASQEPGEATGVTHEDPKPTGADPYAGLIPESKYPIEIGLEKAKEFYDLGGLMVCDAREETEFAMGHIAGALFTPHDEFVADVEWLDATAKSPKPIMIYCDGGDCELSLNLGFALNESGHRRILIFKDGYPAWEDAGYPTETGGHP